MTATQMQTEFKFRLDKFDSLNYPNFAISEIDLILNQAQDRIVKQRYGFSNIKRQSFEETQKRTEDLKAIVINAILPPSLNAPDNIDINASFVTLPVDYWFTVHERVDLNYQDCDGKWITTRVSVYPIIHNEFNKFMANPFKKPSNVRILRLMEKNRAELIFPPNTNLGNYHLRYIKKPIRIDSTTLPTVDCELSDHLHTEIIDESVRIALETIEAKRNNTFDKTYINNE